MKLPKVPINVSYEFNRKGEMMIVSTDNPVFQTYWVWESLGGPSFASEVLGRWPEPAKKGYQSPQKARREWWKK